MRSFLRFAVVQCSSRVMFVQLYCVVFDSRLSAFFVVSSHWLLTGACHYVLMGFSRLDFINEHWLLGFGLCAVGHVIYWLPACGRFVAGVGGPGSPRRHSLSSMSWFCACPPCGACSPAGRALLYFSSIARCLVFVAARARDFRTLALTSPLLSRSVLLLRRRREGGVFPVPRRTLTSRGLFSPSLSSMGNLHPWLSSVHHLLVCARCGRQVSIPTNCGGRLINITSRPPTPSAILGLATAAHLYNSLLIIYSL